MSGTVVAMICRKHGFVAAPICPRCEDEATQGKLYVNTGEWVKGWYEHIDPKGPIYIENKEQLKWECEARGLLARSLMKPKSQEKGYEHKR